LRSASIIAFVASSADTSVYQCRPIATEPLKLAGATDEKLSECESRRTTIEEARTPITWRAGSRGNNPGEPGQLALTLRLPAGFPHCWSVVLALGLRLKVLELRNCGFLSAPRAKKPPVPIWLNGLHSVGPTARHNPVSGHQSRTIDPS
jgi:hypothetical protein